MKLVHVLRYFVKFSARKAEERDKRKMSELKERLLIEVEERRKLEFKVARLTGEKEDLESKLQYSLDKSIMDEVKENNWLATEKKNTQLQNELKTTQDNLRATTEANTQLQNELESTQQQLKKSESENNDLKVKLQGSESKNKELENKIQDLQKNKNKLESQIRDLQKQFKSKDKEINGKKEKFLKASTQGEKQVNYASTSFILSGICAVGASLTVPYLAISTTLAVAALAFFTVGCCCLYKANTALSDVKAGQISGTDKVCAVKKSDTRLII